MVILAAAFFAGAEAGVGGETALVFFVAAGGDVASGLERGGDAFLGGGFVVVRAPDVPDGAAVGDVGAVEVPLVAEDVLDEEFAGAAGGAVEGAVDAHDGADVGVAHGDFKGGEVGFVEVAFGWVHAHGVAEFFGAAVDGEVFHAGHGFHVVGVVALEAADVDEGHLAGEERVLAVGFLAASPAGVAEDVYAGAVEGEAVALGDGAVVLRGVGVVSGSGLGGDGLGLLLDEGEVPGGGHADGLGEHGGGVIAAHEAVEVFVAVAVGGDAEAGDGQGAGADLGDFFLEGELGDEVVDAGFERGGGVAPERARASGGGASDGGCANE